MHAACERKPVVSLVLDGIVSYLDSIQKAETLSRLSGASAPIFLLDTVPSRRNKDALQIVGVLASCFPFSFSPLSPFPPLAACSLTGGFAAPAQRSRVTQTMGHSVAGMPATRESSDYG